MFTVKKKNYPLSLPLKLEELLRGIIDFSLNKAGFTTIPPLVRLKESESLKQEFPLLIKVKAQESSFSLIPW